MILGLVSSAGHEIEVLRVEIQRLHAMVQPLTEEKRDLEKHLAFPAHELSTRG